MLLERTKIREFIHKVIKALFSENTSKAISKYFEEGNNIFFRYISSQVIDAIIIGITSAIILWAVDVKYAVLLALMIGIMKLIPILGSMLSTTIVTLITAVSGNTAQAIWIFIILIIIHQIDVRFIKPRLATGLPKLSPVLIIFAIVTFGAYYGAFGMFLALPVAAVLKIMLNDFIQSRVEE